MGKYIYMNCNAGISGDMMVGALIGLGADKEMLMTALRSLGLSGFETIISDVKKGGEDAVDFLVKLDAAHENHDHDMEYLHGGQEKCAKPADGEEHEHAGHGEHTGHAGHDGHGHHRHVTLSDVLGIIEGSALSGNAKAIASRIFEILAEGEAAAHGTTKDKVHFHEVGALDSIADICACAFCIDNLGIEGAYIPSVSEGFGTVRCAHGVLDIPVPATKAIIEKYGIPLAKTGVAGEFVTPTGAAIAAALRVGAELPAGAAFKKRAVGAGKRAYEIASLLRADLYDMKGARICVL